jgi:hypothetical protein
MIAEYLKQRNIAAACYVIGMGAAIALKVSGHRALTEWLVWPIFAALVAACWFYLKAKKRSGGWLLLLPLNIIALVIYWSMEDCSEKPDNVACAACGTANFPGDQVCRLCKSTMPAPVTAGYPIET